MAEDLEKFINDWKVDIKNKSATHKSGLNIEYDSTNEDGTLRLTYSGMSTFLRTTFAETKSIEAVEQRRADLTQEFVEIFKQRMTPTFEKTIISKPQREM